MSAFTVEDDKGENPTGVPGSFDFEVEFDITPEDPGYMYDSNGDGYPGYPATAEIVSARCTAVWLEDTALRKPTPEEQTVFTDWFFTWLADRPDVESDMCHAELESMCEADCEPYDDY
jgi:hypothetical protein